MDQILYIDDENSNLSSFGLVFKHFYQVFTTNNPDEAIEILTNNNIKLVISDYRMPEINGLDFLYALKTRFPNVVRVLLTAYHDLDIAIDAINRVNIFQFILKPWKREYMHKTIDSAIAYFNLKENNDNLITSLSQKNEQLKQANTNLQHEIEQHNQTQTQLRKNSAFLNTIMQSTSDIILTCNSNFEIKQHFSNSVNNYPLNLSSNTHLTSIFEISAENLQEIISHLAKNKTYYTETKLNNSPRTAIIHLLFNQLPAFDSTSEILVVGRDITKMRISEQNLLTTLINTEENEKYKFASDLYDELGPFLSGIKLYIDELGQQHDSNEKKRLVTYLHQMVDQAIVKTTSISNNLTPYLLNDYGFDKTLRSFIYKIEKLNNINIIYHSTFTQRFDKIKETVLYRIVTELINNTLKHANAKNIQIKFHALNNNTLELVYSDNGIGFNFNKQLTELKSFGLQTIINRIKSIDGQYCFHQVKKGIKYTFTIKHQAV